MPESPPIQANSQMLFEHLIKEFQGNPEYQQRIVVHIRTKFGHSTLPNFHNNGVSEQDKFKTYGECLAAIITHRKGVNELAQAKKEGDRAKTKAAQEKIDHAFKALQGQIQKGQAVPTETPEPKLELSTKSHSPDSAQEPTQVEPPSKQVGPMAQPLALPGSDPAALIAQAMRLMAGTVSPEQVRSIVDEQLKSFKPAMDSAAIAKLIEQSVAKRRWTSFWPRCRPAMPSK